MRQSNYTWLYKTYLTFWIKNSELQSFYNNSKESARGSQNYKIYVTPTHDYFLVVMVCLPGCCESALLYNTENG